MAKAKIKTKLDVMSITVLLVISLFSGLIGYYLGQSAGISAAIQWFGIR